MKSACFFGFNLLCACLISLSCQEKRAEERNFTKADSVTGTYLSLQDTMVQVWNTMIHDDNRKINAMRDLLHELSISNPGKASEISDYEKRLDALAAMRYDQQSISDAGVVAEYDFASNSLVTELITLAEAEREFAYNTTLQKLVDSIRSADQRILNYRAEYDDIAQRFNRFIEQHEGLLEDMHIDSAPSKKPLFQMAAE